MSRRILAARSAQTLKPDPSRLLKVPDAVVPGLYLVVQSSGKKSWALGRIVSAHAFELR